jgi:FlaA1/EpsC-like NDP-sugar epimerase
VLNNIVGTMNLLEVADEFRAERVVCISTDKAVNPTSVMGCCKRVAELLVQGRLSGDTNAVAVRFGNVLGSRGSVIPVFQRQIERGGPVMVTHPEIRRFFMTIQEASQLVIQAGALGQPGDLFILDMGEPVKILDLARDMIRLAGYEPDVDIPVRITGLRPGEKITEELVLPTESCEPTAHEKILRVCIEGRPRVADLARGIAELTELAVAMDFPAIVRTLQRMVPEYRPAAAWTQATGPETSVTGADRRTGERPAVRL